MKSFLVQLTVIAFLSSLFCGELSLAEGKYRRWSLFAGGGGALHTIGGNSSLQARPHLGIEVAFPFGLTLGNSYHYVEAPFGPGKVKQSGLAFRLGWHFLERALQVLGRYDFVTTEFSNYESGSHSGFGVETIYRMPLTKNERFFLNFGAGWSYVDKVTVRRDTGKPVTNSDFSNSLCNLFSFGLSSGCGNIFENVTVPKSSYWNLGAAVSWVW